MHVTFFCIIILPLFYHASALLSAVFGMALTVNVCLSVTLDNFNKMMYNDTVFSPNMES